MTISPSTPHTSPAIPANITWLREIRAFWAQFIIAAFNPYRPEAHYMRGPGPACRRARAEARGQTDS
jgi:hypothetical protein